jgi:hypothetical protein
MRKLWEKLYKRNCRINYNNFQPNFKLIITKTYCNYYRFCMELLNITVKFCFTIDFYLYWNYNIKKY